MGKIKIGPSCVKGIPCGSSCISKLKACIDELDKDLQTPIHRFTRRIIERLEKIGQSEKAISEVLKLEEAEAVLIATKMLERLINEEKRITSGEGSASLTKEEVTALMANRKRLENEAWSDPKRYYERYRRVFDMQDKFIDAVWNGLDRNTRTALSGKGSLPSGEYWDPSKPNGLGNPNVARGKLILRRYLETDGRDVYTGRRIGLLSSDLEHIHPRGQVGLKAETPDNIYLVSKSVNQTKLDLTMKDFFENRVVPKSKWTKEQWDVETKKINDGILKSKSDPLKVLSKQASEDFSLIDKKFIDSFGKKYYYINRELGLTSYYRDDRDRGNPLPKKIGVPILLAFTHPRVKPEHRAKLRELNEEILHSLKSSELKSKPGRGMKTDEVFSSVLRPGLKEILPDAAFKELEVNW